MIHAIATDSITINPYLNIAVGLMVFSIVGSVIVAGIKQHRNAARWASKMFMCIGAGSFCWLITQMVTDLHDLWILCGIAAGLCGLAALACLVVPAWRR
jgi:hypothetical protein